MKKIILALILFSMSGMLFAENRTGIVIDIKTWGVADAQLAYIFIDSNNDKIVDAIIYLQGNIRDKGGLEQLILFWQIKNGSLIVYNFNAKETLDGIFIDKDGKSIISSI